MTQSKKDIKFSNIIFQFCISMLSCFFDLLPGELHQEVHMLTINSDNHLQSAACFENLPEQPNMKCTCIQKCCEWRMEIELLFLHLSSHQCLLEKKLSVMQCVESYDPHGWHPPSGGDNSVSIYLAIYHQISNISHTSSQNLYVSCLFAIVFVQSVEARC